MLVAREKKKSNIAEYILYMWQIEDIVRGLGLDILKVGKVVVDRYRVSDEVRKEIYDWYDNLIEMMKYEGVTEKGHVQVLKNVVDELTELHFLLLYKEPDPMYRRMIMEHAPLFVEYRKRSGIDDGISDVEMALQALYGYMMLKLKGREISRETSDAMGVFSKIIAYLSACYKKKEEEDEKEDVCR